MTLSETELQEQYPPLPSDVSLSHTIIPSLVSENDVSSDQVTVQVSWNLPIFTA